MNRLHTKPDEFRICVSVGNAGLDMLLPFAEATELTSDEMVRVLVKPLIRQLEASLPTTDSTKFRLLVTSDGIAHDAYFTRGMVKSELPPILSSLFQQVSNAVGIKKEFASYNNW